MAADNLIYCVHVQVTVDGGISYIPEGSGDDPQCSVLEMLDLVAMMFSSTAPKLDCVGPYRMEGGHVEKAFVGHGECGLSAEKPPELLKTKFYFSTFSVDMGAIGEVFIKVNSQILG